MKVITLDVETIQPRWDGDEDAFPPITYHQPVVISWLRANDELIEFEVHDRHSHIITHPDDEVTALLRLSSHLRDCDRLVTWNGRRFDMPLLALRAVVHGVNWRWWTKRRHRYSRYKHPLWHYDLADQFSDCGATSLPGLSDVCALLAISVKTTLEGGSVAERWAEGQHEEVARYCEEDVTATWEVYKHWRRAMGEG